ncbi:M42 family metallopeptidase [Alicyclobacillus cycloheptanicus]|uniref:Endoglucanase n=1 Tax=Alicyclobacillus cycloheptanicus TaxID=1457 RepID=A0ABT9XFC9_9BACL|nr:M42 family metallopeptidase [Alicyclobacillus cycloheptanicus]MDQ0188538.1 endoglucanase [Alicyclobacillus cycloheptanicus]WDM01223.1 M42 family metallopeptidase [Alicyclobacillus cycloheptanicus]
MSSPSFHHHRDTFLELLDSHAGPGFEHPIAAKMERFFSLYSADIRTDTLGNLMARIVPPAAPANARVPRILLAAHMDEIALVVTQIDQGGFLRVWDAHAFDPRTLVGQEVLVHTHDGDALLGIVGSKPPHLSSPAERKRAPKLEDLFVDLAMPETAVRERVRVGDRITVRRGTMELLNGRIAGKALDNRASLAVVLECLAALQQLRHTAEVYAAATVQEEVGLRGAMTAAYGVNPDIAIAIDVTFAGMPGQAPDESFEMGKGPVITMGPNLHPKVFRQLRDTAMHHNVPYQIEFSQGPTGTDAAALQIAREGLATGLVGVAIRYMHTSVETASYDDIAACGRLLAHFIASIDLAMVEGLTCY